MNDYRSRNGDAFVHLRDDDLGNGHRVLVVEELEQHHTVIRWPYSYLPLSHSGCTMNRAASESSAHHLRMLTGQALRVTSVL
jgi:hypothetical protein